MRVPLVAVSVSVSAAAGERIGEGDRVPLADEKTSVVFSLTEMAAGP